MPSWVWIPFLLSTWWTADGRQGFGRQVKLPSGRRTHYLVLDHRGDGSYKYGYDTGTGGPAQLFHQEERSADGKVKGSYGYLDRAGLFRIVQYSADETGFHVLARPFVLTAEGPLNRPYPPFVGPLPPFLHRPV